MTTPPSPAPQPEQRPEQGSGYGPGHGPTLGPGSGPSPINRAARAVRSGLRRYPREILRSIMGRGGLPLAGEEGLLHLIAPHELALTWLGHAGVACQMGEASIVVDPVLSHRIGPRVVGRTIGLPRLASPPVEPALLRDADALLITHAHFDHLDKPTLQAMADPATTAVIPLGCSRLMPSGFGRLIELAPGQDIELDHLRIKAVQPNHWGARTVLDRNRGVNSYLVSSSTGSAGSSTGATVLFAGDTAETDVFDAIEGVDVAVFGIGAYEPWEHMHATPEQVWTMFRALGARYLLPIHHSTYELSDEPIDEPMQRLLRVAGDDSSAVLVGAPGDVLVVKEGKTEGSR